MRVANSFTIMGLGAALAVAACGGGASDGGIWPDDSRRAPRSANPVTTNAISIAGTSFLPQEQSRCRWEPPSRGPGTIAWAARAAAMARASRTTSCSTTAAGSPRRRRTTGRSAAPSRPRARSSITVRSRRRRRDERRGRREVTSGSPRCGPRRGPTQIGMRRAARRGTGRRQSLVRRRRRAAPPHPPQPCSDRRLRLGRRGGARETALAARGAKQVDRGVHDHDQYEPVDHVQRERVTRNAAISTAGMPASVMRRSIARTSYPPVRTKRTLASGMRKAHEPIMIGKAVVAFIPRRLMSTMQGPYRPMPMVMKGAEHEVSCDTEHELHSTEGRAHRRLAA